MPALQFGGRHCGWRYRNRPSNRLRWVKAKAPAIRHSAVVEEKIMTGGKTLRAELDELRAEIAQLRESRAEPAGETDSAEAGGQLAELNRLVQQMLEDAEETIAQHPAAAVAGALALGIVIGRLTAR